MHRAKDAWIISFWLWLGCRSRSVGIINTARVDLSLSSPAAVIELQVARKARGFSFKLFLIFQARLKTLATPASNQALFELTQHVSTTKHLFYQVEGNTVPLDSDEWTVQFWEQLGSDTCLHRWWVWLFMCWTWSLQSRHMHVSSQLHYYNFLLSLIHYCPVSLKTCPLTPYTLFMWYDGIMGGHWTLAVHFMSN